MGSKYREYASTRKTSDREYTRIHPVWRGVGFALMVLIPIISWALQSVVIDRNLIPIPGDLIAGPGQFLYSIYPDPLINFRLMIFVAAMLLLFALFTFFTFLLNSMFGVTRRSDPFYVPPPRRQPRRRK
jgi:hypothetical protein